MAAKKFHDRGYKALFSFPKMVEYLVRSFVKADFVEHVDFSTLRKINSTFVSEDFRQRETDVIWEVNVRGTTAYLYFLIEFQSTVDRFMALRVLHYLLSFYQDLIKQKKLHLLPPVFPIVLYNGDDRWTAPLEVAELIEPSLTGLGPHIPRFVYYKIAENEFSYETLSQLDNLVAKMFMVETCGPAELPGVIRETTRILRTEVDLKLQRHFGLWVRAGLRKRKIDVNIAKLDDMEVQVMFETRMQKFEDEVMQRGRQEGLKERQEALRRTLSAMLEARFGAGGAQLKDKIATLEDTEVLERLFVTFAGSPDLATFLRYLDLQPPTGQAGVSDDC